MTRFAILIVKSDTASFEQTLASVLANRPANCDVFVVCPGGYDDPYELAGEVHFIHAATGEASAELIRIGLRHLPHTCEIVHLLACGLTVEEGWTEAAVACFRDCSVGAVAPLVLRDDGRIAAAGIRLDLFGSPRLAWAGRRVARAKKTLVLGASLDAAFYRVPLLAELAGLDMTYQGWLGDVDIALRLGEAGFRCVLSQESRVLGELHCRSGMTPFREARLKERFYWRHRPSTWALLIHPLIVGLETLINLRSRSAMTGLLGRFVGLLQAPFDARRRRQSGQQANVRILQSGELDDTQSPADHTDRSAA